jgi:hypothetical protein
MERATIDHREPHTAPKPDRVAEVTRLLSSRSRCSRCVQMATVAIATTIYCRSCADVELARRERRQFGNGRTVRPVHPRPRVEPGASLAAPVGHASTDVAAATAKMRRSEDTLRQALQALKQLEEMARRPPR